MSTVTLKNLSKRYEDADSVALQDLNIEVRDGEFLVLVGPSGCGKSTALKMIGGLESITGGEVMIGERVINDFASRDRDIAMVFQSYALYPHMSVYDNIAFPLQIAKVGRAEIEKRVKDVSKILQLDPYLHRRPGNLSGGQRQRVAMGRAIIRRPSVFLMDEPLSNLDAKLRVKMRSEVAQIQRQLKVTTIYVTHDQVEAMTMGDRVALMRDGVLQQIDTPHTIYHEPRNTFVASFIGSPAMNLFRARLDSQNGELYVSLGEQQLPVTRLTRQRYPGLEQHSEGDVIVGIRPEDLEDAALVPEHPLNQRLQAPVVLLESLGSDQMAHVQLDADTVTDADDEDDTESLMSSTAASGICICRFAAQSPVKAGTRVTIAVACDRLHFFDAATGRALREDT